MIGKRLSQKQLHSMFLRDLGSLPQDVIDTGRKPLLMRLKYPFNRDVKVYIFNCTSPPGGRSYDEFKVQLIRDGQKRGERGRFDASDGRTIMIVGYASPFADSLEGIWVLFETAKHMDFAYSANIQVYLRQMLPTLENRVHVCTKNNKETLVLSQRQHLSEALSKRFDYDLFAMMGKT